MAPSVADRVAEDDGVLDIDEEENRSEALGAEVEVGGSTTVLDFAKSLGTTMGVVKALLNVILTRSLEMTRVIVAPPISCRSI